METDNIAIFASGNGSNAQRIVDYFIGIPEVRIQAIFTNKKDAGVIEIANNMDIPVVIFSKDDFYKSDMVLQKLREFEITHIVLAGFLWLIPPGLIDAYRNKIINIHPALLPKFGGKGMYGRHVHEAVKAANERETGITIHLVNENYDEGKYILQKKIELTGLETPEEIAQKVQALEHEYFPQTIERWVSYYYSWRVL